MAQDPFVRLPTRARLWLACGLCVLPLGLVWSISPGGLTLGNFSACAYTTAGAVCQIAIVPTSVRLSHALLGSQAPVRVFLVFAAFVLAYAAAHRRTASTKRLVRMATVAMAVTAVLAVPNQAFLACQLGALALVVPLVWRRRAVFCPSANGPVN